MEVQGVDYIVAIGGSAGALEAFERFVTSLSDGLNAAYIFLQHMDPSQKSLLPGFLSITSPLPVHIAQDGLVIEKNQIYVLQPGTSLTLKGRKFSCRPIDNIEERRHPIDIFFNSLANQCSKQAIGIVMSGTGTDGANGLRSIREFGGRTFVQSPHEAKYEGMPQAAIAAGVADQVLSVKEMAQVVSNLIVNNLDAKNEFSNPEELKEVCEVLLKLTGHDFSAYKKSTVARRVERRVQANNFTSVKNYIEFLKGDAVEAQALLKDLLISVTQFFRDPEAFLALKELVIPKIFCDLQVGEAVRVWIPACATGEEAYTMAILLKEYEREHELSFPIQIFATDIDRAALELARAGLYPFTIAENIPTEHLEKYFSKEESGYRAKQELRETCIFSEHSLLKNPPFSRIDLISCRNLFIYWEAELQNKILPVFHYALNVGGHLFLGPAESVAGTAELFNTVDKKHRIFQKNEVTSRAHLYFPMTHAVGATSRAQNVEVFQPYSERDTSKSIVSTLLEDFAPPAFVISELGDIVFFSGKTGKYLEPPTGAPTNVIYDVIRRSIRPELHALMHKSVKTKSEVSYPSLTFENEGLVQRVRLTVRPFLDQSNGRMLYLVIFQELMIPKTLEEADHAGITISSKDAIVQQLESELRETREHLQSTVEEVKSSNEELLSMNEELQSANEELQTSKEELQSTNEELETVNSELSKKVEELDSSNGDLQNFFTSAQVPIIFLDTKFRIQRFTPAATLIFRLIPSDIGRGILDINSDLDNPSSFVDDFSKVLETLHPMERELSSRDGKCCFIMRVSPYRTIANVIDGVIATFTDITDLKLSQKKVEHSHTQLVDVMESMSDAFFSIDKNWVINQVNRHHELLSQKSREEQIGKNLNDLFFYNAELRNSGYLRNYEKAMKERVPVYFEEYYAPLNLWTGVSAYPKSDGGLAVFFRDIAEEKKSKLRLESERQKLEAVFSESPAGMAILRGPELIFEKINTKWPELVGGIREYIGKSYVEVHPELAETYIPQALRTVLETGVSYTNSEAAARIEISKGIFEDRYYSVNFARILDGDGKPYGVYCHTLNVTEVVLARKRLEESDRSFQELTNSLPQIIWTASPDGVVEYFNDRWYEFTGNKKGSPDGKVWVDILHPDDFEMRNKAFNHAIKTGNPYRLEYRIKDRKSGKYKWFLGTAVALRDEHGNIVRWFGSSTDIDEQKQAGVEIQRAKQELQDFIMQAPLGIAMLSGANHTYSVLNPMFMTLCFGGRPVSDFLGKTVRAALPELAGQGFYELLDEVYRTGNPFVGVKHRAVMMQANGQEKELFLNFTYQAKRNQGGRIDGILVVIYEVTDQVNEQREFEVLADNLRSAILSRDNFLGIASHELNTPLTSLKLQLQMSKRTLEKKGMMGFTQESLGKVLDNNLFLADRLARLINDMLDVSRVGTGKLSVSIVPTDFSALVMESLERFKMQLEVSDCEVNTEITPKLIVPLDASRIEQVLANLITNVIKYAPRHPVLIKLEKLESKAKFSIIDHGKGVAFEHQDRIFGRFERATSPNDVSGLGLGLYICKQIIDEHGGKIYVESKEGDGATFSFELPL
jgi:two-component system CheB/CheR fusion protein